MKYTQVTLKRDNVSQVSWIPSTFAKVNEVLMLKDKDGNWEYGWIVDSLGHTLSEELLPDSHVAIKQHRKRTGDSLPKK